MKAVHGAAQRNPVLAACLVARLADMLNRLLSLCGDEVTGWRRQARIRNYGCAAASSLFGSLMTQADLSLTLSRLDKELRRAAEWAVSFVFLMLLSRMMPSHLRPPNKNQFESRKKKIPHVAG